MTILPLGNPLVVRVERAVAALTAACVACSLAATPVAVLANDRPATGTTRSRVSDPAVRPAGGAGCQSCGPGGCGQSLGRHHGHQAGCRDGVCVPYCPVRPEQFGFYGTQWRRWPGSAVAQVSGTRDAGPVSPPRSSVPGPNEESLNPQAEQEPAVDQGADAGGAANPVAPRQPLPDPAAAPEPVTEPAAPRALEPAPETRRELPPGPKPVREPGSVPEPMTQPEPEPKVEAPLPPAEPGPLPVEPSAPAPGAKPRPEDENLFEAVSGLDAGRRAQRRFAVGAAAADGQAGGQRAERVEPATHLDGPAPNRLPRVFFDPAAETRRLRAAR